MPLFSVDRFPFSKIALRDKFPAFFFEKTVCFGAFSPSSFAGFLLKRVGFVVFRPASVGKGKRFLPCFGGVTGNTRHFPYGALQGAKDKGSSNISGLSAASSGKGREQAPNLGKPLGYGACYALPFALCPCVACGAFSGVTGDKAA